MIESFSFGQIIIDGKTYYSDVVIYPDHIQSEWWRKEGHSLTVEDVDKLLAIKPDILMVGTGYGGFKVPIETEDYIKSKGIKLIVQETEKICEKFDELSKSNKVVAALHLSC